jgi:AcrR family transcriptional regulator
MARGRPRQFDAEEALDRALEVFWRKGYEGTSLPDLTEAMGINRPSLYAAFGNKEALFHKAIERYSQQKGSHVREALAQPTAKKVAEHLLRGAVDFLTSSKGPRGCFVVQSALVCGDEAEPVKAALMKTRKDADAAVRRRFQKAHADGDLPKSANPVALASYISTVIRGMSVQAASGASRKQLGEVAELALRAWPK